MEGALEDLQTVLDRGHGLLIFVSLFGMPGNRSGNQHHIGRAIGLSLSHEQLSPFQKSAAQDKGGTEA